MAQFNSIQYPTENARVEVQAPGSSDWLFIPGTASIAESGTEAPTREVSTLVNKIQVVGNVAPPTIEFTISAYAPAHDTNRVLRDALINNTILSFRYRFDGQVLNTVAGAGNTVGIATTGVVTFAWADDPLIDFTNEAYGPGISIKPAGRDRYIVDSISAAGELKVKPVPNAAITGVVGYEIEVPPIYRPSFPARVMSFDNVDAGSESSLATSLGVAPTSILPRFESGVPS